MPLGPYVVALKKNKTKTHTHTHKKQQQKTKNTRKVKLSGKPIGFHANPTLRQREHNFFASA